jgi:membrane-bound inhibitor of C-type lysozyme
MPFGVFVSYCDTSWFVLFNAFPFQVSGETKEEVVSGAFTDFTLSSEWRDRWHVAENIGNSITLANEQDNTLSRITMSVIEMSTEEDPKEWIDQRVDFDDVTTLNYEWIFVNDVQQVRVDYDGPNGPTRSDYLLGEGTMVVVTQNPLDADYNTERLYTMLMHTNAYELVDSVYSRAILRENCAQEVPAKDINDISVNEQYDVATFHWTNYETDESQRLFVAYEPETGFAGCSASVTDLLADRSEAVSFACPNDYQLTMIYLGEENEEALLQLPTETHRVSVARSGSGARYTNEDESVVFWEHQGEAMIEKNGEVVREQCIMTNG